MYDAFFEERHLIPAGRYHEVRFEELERAPIGEMQKLYEGLGFSGFEKARPGLQRYVDSLSGYRKNNFGELDPALRAKVAAAWRRSFDEWRYPI
jgi:hypothetical protein